MAKSIMIMGTMSSAGKSFVTAGLCRIFYQDGYKTAPFKSQNMALNSYITENHLEMGRAQVMQAESACITPDIRMNPILLKPTSEKGSQIILNGEVFGNMTAKEYYQKKQEFIPYIKNAYESLAQDYDIIVLEGAGSPAEINLKEVDIVNMGMAKISNSPVILVGDIDRGGVFASLYGTVALLDEQEKKLIKGFIINKFRGDVEILKSGLTMLEDLTGIPVLGVLPYANLDLDDEDSLSERLLKHEIKQDSLLDIAIIQFPRISNFTDFQALERIESISVRYVSKLQELQNPDMIILAGTKNTISDLLWLRQNGLEAGILKAHEKGCVIFGICGGFQMLGQKISDTENIENNTNKTVRGLQLLEIETIFQTQKRRTQIQGRICADIENLSEIKLNGYEIHMGETHGNEKPFIILETGETDGYYKHHVFGTYLHGIFDNQEFTENFLNYLIQKKNNSEKILISDFQNYKQMQYDKLADLLRKNLNMQKIYEILETGNL